MRDPPMKVGVIRWIGTAIGLAAGAAIVIAGWIWRGAMSDDAPEFLLTTATGLAAVGRIVVEIALGMMRGKTFVAAAGIDESRKTSPIVVVMAMPRVTA